MNRKGLDFETRFNMNVVKPEDRGGCWVWIGSKANGYGRIYKDGVAMPAHRASYEFYKSVKVPRDLVACHKCDNRWCVNPDHIFIGTHSDNQIDCRDKGRRTYFFFKGHTPHNKKEVCQNGHAMSGDNIGKRAGGRYCLQCSRDRARARRKKARQKPADPTLRKACERASDYKKETHHV